jgi:hypothetical protein
MVGEAEWRGADTGHGGDAAGRLHWPVQVPASKSQMNGHSAATYVPSPVHVSMARSLAHRVALGEQTPPQSPFLQTKGHSFESIHAPATQV